MTSVVGFSNSVYSVFSRAMDFFRQHTKTFVLLVVIAFVATSGAMYLGGNSGGNKETNSNGTQPKNMLYKPSKHALRSGATRVIGRRAPALRVKKWTPGDRKPPVLSSLRGKVVVIFAFQSWCPGCHKRGFPVTNQLAAHFKDQSVEVIYLQTTFEGHAVNTFAAALKEKAKYKIKRPIGQDSTIQKKYPYTMAAYRTGGTPWTIVIDKTGRVRFNDFTRTFAFHKQLVAHLLKN